eukprot:Skav226189  [mRNA]  locus=scaffold2212:102830:105483:+ [translate_table: standard]
MPAGCCYAGIPMTARGQVSALPLSGSVGSPSPMSSLRAQVGSQWPLPWGPPPAKAQFKPCIFLSSSAMKSMEGLGSYGASAARPAAAGQPATQQLPKHLRDDLEIQQLCDLYQSQLAELNACHSLLTVDQERLATMSSAENWEQRWFVGS